jgi:hypothetical protein
LFDRKVGPMLAVRYIPVIPALGSLRQEELKFEAT